MTRYVRDGILLPQGQPFVINFPGVGEEAPYSMQYPANWLDCATPEERAAIGIEEHPDVSPPDPRFYVWTGNPDGSITMTPRDPAIVRDEMVRENKAMAYMLLQPTDWMVIRGIEGVPLEPEIEAYRRAVRVASNENEANLDLCTTIEELAAFVPVWPAPVEGRKAR
jgi:hypothetical protein